MVFNILIISQFGLSANKEIINTVFGPLLGQKRHKFSLACRYYPIINLIKFSVPGKTP